MGICIVFGGNMGHHRHFGYYRMKDPEISTSNMDTGVLMASERRVSHSD